MTLPWRTKRLLILSPVLLGAGIAAFYGLANWWGVRGFEREVSAMKAEGLPTTLEEAFGPVPAAEEDVFQHPALAAEFSRSGTDKLDGYPQLLIPGLTSRTSKWESQPDWGKAADLRQLPEPARSNDQEEVVARELLALMEPRSRRFDELAEAFQRPRWHWGKEWETGVGRALSFTPLSRFVRLRAVLRLAADQPQQAAEDVKTLIRLEQKFAAHPGSMASYLILLEIERQTSRAIWEGVERRVWTEARLAEFQSELASLDFSRTFVEHLPGEIAFSAAQLRAVVEDPSLVEKEMADREAREKLVVWSEERGLWDRMNAQLGKWMEKATPFGLRLRPATRHLTVMREFYARLRTGSPGRLMVGQVARELEAHPDSYGMLWQCADRAMAADTRRSLLLTGIALERYRLRHGAVPGKLDALVPEFLPELPKDVCDGQPPRYRVLADGSPHLWSLWPSGRDEGGMPKSAPGKGNTVWTTGQIPGLTKASYNGR